ncbi:MAG: hypothetical protein EA416_14235 [Trueperaceae bacterium]|nr:MAG: hypothetical protein EA416_14235 [Trueperaceae bacterium]
MSILLTMLTNVRASARRTNATGWSSLVALVVLLASSSTALAGEHDWELRVCAAFHNPPMSSSTDGGVNNDIAAVLADELGARLTFEWILLDRVGVQRSLHRGTCDVVIGIGESVTGVVSSVPYLRVPYVFLTRSDRGIDIESLDDPVLRELTIATYPTGLPSVSLENRGIVESVREISPITTPQGLDRDTPVIDAVVDGSVDVAIVYGAAAARRALAEPGLLTIVPVTPELDFGPTILPLYRTWTIGVRPHDVDFRQRLNVALAARWDEITELIAGYGVPQLRVSRPPTAPATDPGVIRVGVIAPSQTREAHGMELIGEAARRGAILAENSIARAVDRDDVRFEVLFASAPSHDSAVRAAERLTALHGVQAIVGGFDDEEAEALSDLAAARGVVFFNVGSGAPTLRGSLCRPTTLHVAASTDMYVDAIVIEAARSDASDWFVLTEDGLVPEGYDARVAAALDRSARGGSVVGSARVPARQFVYFDVLDAIRASEAAAVLVVLGTEATDQFLVQYEMMGLDAVVAVVPNLMSQTRPVLLRYRQAAPRASAAPRPAVWDTTLTEHGADDLNERYTSRNAEPMEGVSWTTYAAVMSVFQATKVGAAADAATMLAYLADDTTELDVAKGPGVGYRSWNGQLRQPLYLIEVDPEAAWGSSVSARVALARVLEVVPMPRSGSDVRERLDRLGDDAATSDCTF